ncbi:MAG: YfiR family protein [Candidatus Riflebacteria bacterium]|nr:YfiR family protein [Candidatus Riflebacteria bacterium]
MSVGTVVGRSFSARFLRLGKVFLILLFLSANIIDAAEQADEYVMKMAYLFKLTYFVDWSAVSGYAASGSFVMGVTVPNSFNGTLADVPVGAAFCPRGIHVIEVHSIADLERCNLIYFDPKSSIQDELLQTANRTGVLTVGDGTGFLDKGGMIAFTLENNRLRFSINLVKAQGAGIKIKSQLLSLAVDVRR